MDQAHSGWVEKRRNLRVESILRVQYMPLEDKEVPNILSNDSFKDTHIEKLSKNLGAEKIIEGFTQDMSTGGLCLASEKQLKSGQHLLLEMVLPTPKRTMRVIAMVARVISEEKLASVVYRCGIQIISIHKEDLEALERYIQNRAIENSLKKR